MQNISNIRITMGSRNFAHFTRPPQWQTSFQLHLQFQQPFPRARSYCSSKPKKKFYAVAHGRKTGIFDNWNQVKPLVNGFCNNMFKSFGSRKEAQKYLNSCENINFDASRPRGGGAEGRNWRNINKLEGDMRMVKVSVEEEIMLDLLRQLKSAAVWEGVYGVGRSRIMEVGEIEDEENEDCVEGSEEKENRKGID